MKSGFMEGATMQDAANIYREREPSYRIRLLGDPILTTRCEPITSYDEVLHLVANGLFAAMLRICYEPRYGFKPGLGISANQVGSLARMCFGPLGEKKVFFLNPRILGTSEQQVTLDEGCLSIPGFYTPVTRPAIVDVEYEDELFKTQRATLKHIDARCFQHELDHLNGKLLPFPSRQLRRQFERKIAGLYHG